MTGAEVMHHTRRLYGEPTWEAHRHGVYSAAYRAGLSFRWLAVDDDEVDFETGFAVSVEGAKLSATLAAVQLYKRPGQSQKRNGEESSTTTTT